MKDNKVTLKSQIVLPLLFIMSLAVGICFIAVPDFLEDVDTFVVWLYFAVDVLYIFVSIFDYVKDQEKSPKLKTFILIFIILSIIATALYLTFYLCKTH